jgi:hypothetical protein
VRLASETSLSPGWLLIAFPAVLYPLYLALEALFGRGLAEATAFSGDFAARFPLTLSTMLGYAAMMYTYAARGTFRDLEALRPVLQTDGGTYSELRRQLTRFERRRLRLGGLIGIAFALIIQEGVFDLLTLVLAWEFSVRDVCAGLLGFAFWITGGRGTMYLIDSARLYSRIGERHVAVDLLDLGPLSPLTQHGLRIVLLLVIITAAGLATLAVGNPFMSGSLVIVMFVAFVWNAALAAAAFVLPVRGLRRQIRARKVEELARVREEIRLDRDLVARRGPDSAEAGARLPGLMVYEQRIESVREWPFDAPTLARFFLYVAIPLGSWIGGALVERLLGAALD